MNKCWKFQEDILILVWFNPNQTVLFSSLRNCGGEESRRSSFCHIILLSLDLGHLFCLQTLIRLFWMLNNLICYLKMWLVLPSVFCPLRNCGGEESRRNLFSSFPCPKGYKKQKWATIGPEIVQKCPKISNSTPKYPTVVQKYPIDCVLIPPPHSFLMTFFAQNSKFYKFFEKNAII